MKDFAYEGLDKNGRLVRGSTAGTDEQQVRKQLKRFGFTNIRIEEQVGSQTFGDQFSGGFGRESDAADVGASDPFEGHEIDEEEWKRADALARARRHRHRENIALVISLILIGTFAAYFLYDKLTEIPAPQPTIITNTTSEMLSLKDVYVKDGNLVFIVYSRNWNGNVRVDFQAWDAFDNRIDFGTARVGFVGEYYGASPEKSGAVRLKKNRFYERIEVLVSGDEDR
jgi:hypothetical protein